MAVTVTDLRTTRSQADGTGGWTGSVAPNLFTSAPDPVELTGHLGQVVNNTRAYLIETGGGSVNLTNTLVYVWFQPGPAMGSFSTDGFGITLSDGSNIIQFGIGGSNRASFRHNIDSIPTYNCMVLDTANLPTQTYAHNGNAGSLNLSAITGIGSGCRTTLKAVGGTSNVFTDVVRYGNGGLQITGGTSGSPGKFIEISQDDALRTSGKALGIFRELGAGVYGTQGPLTFGNITGSDSSWFVESDITLVFEARGFASDKYHITIRDNGTGTTTVNFDGCSFVVPTTTTARWDSSTDTNVDTVTINNTNFTGFGQGITFRAPQDWRNNNFTRCGTVEPNNADMRSSTFINSSASSALLWNFNSETDGKIDGSSFTSSGTGHAIELGSNTPSDITFRNLSFTGYGSDGTTNAVLYNNSGKEITINVIGGGSFTVRNGTGASTILVPEPRTFTLTGLQEDSKVKIVRISDDETLVSTDSSGSSFNYMHSGGNIPIRVIVFHLMYLPLRFDSTLANADQSIPVFQIFDRQYENPD